MGRYPRSRCDNQRRHDRRQHLAVDAPLLLASCLLSYRALRTRCICRICRVERVADAIFVTRMLLMTSVCSIIAYELL
jgi:hypothetical protein